MSRITLDVSFPKCPSYGIPGIVARLRAARPRNACSIPSKWKIFLFSSVYIPTQECTQKVKSGAIFVEVLPLKHEIHVFFLKRQLQPDMAASCVSFLFYYLFDPEDEGSYLPVDITRRPTKCGSSAPLWEPQTWHDLASWLGSANWCCMVKYHLILWSDLMWKILIHCVCRIN